MKKLHLRVERCSSFQRPISEGNQSGQAMIKSSGIGKGFRSGAVLLCALMGHAVAAHASVALLMEEPYGEFGAFNPTGHAAVYLNHVCADTPTQLRMCRPGELGVVISRY